MSFKLFEDVFYSSQVVLSFFVCFFRVVFGFRSLYMSFKLFTYVLGRFKLLSVASCCFLFFKGP